MDIAIINSRTLTGIHSPPVTIEVHLTRGLPSLSIVGLAETAVKESKDRVRSAIINNHYEFPLRRITINLAPADLPKEGSRFDLPIALGILAASGQIPKDRLLEYEFIGELALTGELRPVKGALPAAKAASFHDRILILPEQSAAEAALINRGKIIAAGNLAQVCTHLSDTEPLSFYTPSHSFNDTEKTQTDLAEIIGQEQGKRALEIAATGMHNLIMIGPPGTGKTMLAERLPGILPPMSEEEALETAAIASISSNGFDFTRWKTRPFRNPHHTASGISLVGGGSRPRPGEISLSHNGVLFLDELPEFDRKVLEVLREPMESGRIIISRAAQQVEYPACFQLVAAMNPCPCGFLGDVSGRCHCTEDQVRRYRQRISGPLLDRIDLHVQIPNIPGHLLIESNKPESENSKTIHERVCRAFKIQIGRAGKTNNLLTRKEVDNFCRLDHASTKLLESAIEQLGFSARSLNRILKVSRTIADLADSGSIDINHLGEAISLRCLDRKLPVQNQY